MRTTPRVRALRSDFVQPAEARWFPIIETLGVEQLGLCLIESGLRPNLAFGVARFVESRRQRKEDWLAASTRGRYRHILTDLDPATIGSEQFRGRSVLPAVA